MAADASDLSVLTAKPGQSSLVPGSARSLLLTILSELVWPVEKPVWTWALLHVLKGLGVEEQTARQAIARAAASGWIEPERHGREVRWHLTDASQRIFEEGSPRVLSMKNSFSDWDGTWLTLLVTIPQTHRGSRKKLYAGLTWAGFGNPAPGVWVSPHPERSAEVGHLVERLGLSDNTMSFVGKVTGIGTSEAEIVAAGWNLAALEQYYADVLREFSDQRPASSDEMLFTDVRMAREWQRFPQSDPQLPEALLPDWIGRKVARRIEALRAQWANTVHARFAEVNADDGTTA
jgi:phenylacetic acid degradation operon negative regulatory protein